VDINGRQLVRVDDLIRFIFGLKGCCLIVIADGCCRIVACIIRIIRRVIVHLISYFLFDILEDLPIHKLREGVKLLLVKEGDKVVAESSHFTLSMK
jgi:hypothetical protein